MIVFSVASGTSMKKSRQISESMLAVGVFPVQKAGLCCTNGLPKVVLSVDCDGPKFTRQCEQTLLLKRLSRHEKDDILK